MGSGDAHNVLTSDGVRGTRTHNTTLLVCNVRNNSREWTVPVCFSLSEHSRIPPVALFCHVQ